MRKNTEIWIITGIGLLGLWALYKGRPKNNTIDNRADQTPKTTPKEKTTYVTDTTDIANEVVGTSVWADYNGRPLVQKKKRLSKIAQANVSKFNKHLQSHEKTQLTLTNTSDVEREVTLWGGNKKPPITPLLPGEITDHTFEEITPSSTQGSGVYPQGMVVNPYNGYVYIANQLSNTITVLETGGTVIKVIPIGRSRIYGASPVDIAVNTIPNTANYGKVYIANCISNTISVIDKHLEITNTIEVGSRPLHIAFNSYNNTLAVSNLAEDTVSLIDAQSETVTQTIAVGKTPTHLTTTNENVQFYVINSGDDTISIIGHPTEELITNIGQGLTTMAYHRANKSLYVIASESQEVIPIALDTLTTSNGTIVGADPYRIIYNPNSTLLYVGNRGDNTYSIIDSHNQVKEILALGNVGNNLAFDSRTDNIYSSDSFKGTVTIITYKLGSNAVIINEGYDAKREDFTFNPAIVQHVKFVLSGEQRFKVLKLDKETVSGTTQTQSIAFSNYHNPQNFANVAEVFEMAGTPIDGKHSWRFKIGPKQTITILTYYKQVEIHNLLKKALSTHKTI